MTGETTRRPFRISAFPDPDPALRGGVVAIGNFDGMHRGHQSVLEAARAAGEAAGVPAVVLTFEPHPRDVFRPNEPVFRLTPPHVKARLAEAIGLDGLYTVAFDRDFAKTPADQFVRSVLVETLAVKSVAIGWNFHFGAGRSGNPDSLTRLGQDLGFAVNVVHPYADEGGETISSSRIRALLGEGAIAEAAGLLGWHWFFEGVVVPGDQRGRTIGYPTANLRLPASTRLAHGIYAVLIEFGGEHRPGVASFGRRPTFDNGPPVFETFVFDFTGDLYGKTVTVTPVSYLRPELRFDSVEALVAQMDSDSAEARAVLNGLIPVSPLDRALMGR
jgi:riboflavin kinase/FMN adenylyltransferase